MKFGFKDVDNYPKFDPDACQRLLTEAGFPGGQGLPETVNRMRLRAHEMFFGPAGFGSPDDMEIFRRVHDGLAAPDVGELIFWRGLDHCVYQRMRSR